MISGVWTAKGLSDFTLISKDTLLALSHSIWLKLDTCLNHLLLRSVNTFRAGHDLYIATSQIQKRHGISF
jgi:hypothetical protein